MHECIACIACTACIACIACTACTEEKAARWDRITIPTGSPLLHKLPAMRGIKQP